MAGGRVGVNLTEGNVYKIIIRFAVPMILTNLIQQLYSAVDLIIIGQFIGKTGTVGVATGGEFLDLLTLFSANFAAGGTVYIAQLYGAKKFDKLPRAIGVFFTTLLTMALVAMTCAIVFSNNLLNWQNCPADSFVNAKSYLIIASIGMPFVFAYNAICCTLRGMGESKRPLIFVIVAATSNIFMDLLLVAVFNMGVAGTAIATVAAQIACFIASFIYMYKRRESLGIEFSTKFLRIHKEELLILLKLGIPMALQSLLIHVSMIYMNSFVNGYGTVQSATNSIGNKIYRFINIAVITIQHSGSTVVSQNLGAQKIDRVNQTLRASLVINYTLCAINTIVAIFFPRQIYSIFSNDPEVIEFGVTYMRVLILAFVLSAWMSAFGQIVAGSGASILNMIAGILDGAVVRIAISFLFAFVFNYGIVGFFLGSALSRIAPCIIYTVYYLSGKWKTRKLVFDRRRG